MALQQAVTAQGFGLSSMSQWKGECHRWMTILLAALVQLAWGVLTRARSLPCVYPGALLSVVTCACLCEGLSGATARVVEIVKARWAAVRGVLASTIGTKQACFTPIAAFALQPPPTPVPPSLGPT